MPGPEGLKPTGAPSPMEIERDRLSLSLSRRAQARAAFLTNFNLWRINLAMVNLRYGAG